MSITGEHNHEHHDHDHAHEHAHTDRHIQAWLKTAILLGLGAYFAYNILSGNLANYINNRFAWLSYVAAALFLLLGSISAFDLLRSGDHDHDHAHHDHEHGHVHNHLSWPILAVVAIPLLLGTLVPSRPLGASALEGGFEANAAAAGAAIEGAEFAAFGVNPLDWNLLHWQRAFNYSDDLTEFEGQAADVIGFVYRNEQFPPDHVMVMRFVISCCVADATPVGLPIYWQAPVSLPNDTWVRVQGEFALGDFGGNVAPILQASDVEIIDEPEHPYLYP